MPKNMAPSSLSLYIFLAIYFLLISVVNGIGVNYGIQGDNLPDPPQTIELIKSRNIDKIRIFEPAPAVLDALRNTNIAVYIGVNNQDLKQLATDPTFSTQWVQTNILPYADGSVTISGVVAGNEYIPGPLAEFGLGAMIGLYNALQAANVDVPVTTAVQYGIMGASSPPSSGEFGSDSVDAMTKICWFLEEHNYPLLANIYPYYAYMSDTSMNEDYVFFTSSDAVVQDGDLAYNNIFDCMVDAMYSAMERAGAPNVEIVVSETGWASGGNDFSTVDNAKLYNQNLINHVASGAGTPKRPNKMLETYLFALYNEDLKPAGPEQYWGLYNPDKTEVYHVDIYA
uniref:Uncharacterized protein n=1 Tax=Kalanchoe fedtschenkoi TaxID=63787 RepID=A0A7N0U5I2_KALFE